MNVLKSTVENNHEDMVILGTKTSKKVNLSIVENPKKILGTRFEGMPVANHPLWGEIHNRYADAFNNLAEKLEKAGISIDDLHEVINSTKDYERLSFQYVTGKSTNEFGNLSSYPIQVVIPQEETTIPDDITLWFLNREVEANEILKEKIEKYSGNDEMILEAIREYKVNFFSNMIRSMKMSSSVSKQKKRIFNPSNQEIYKKAIREGKCKLYPQKNVASAGS